MLDRLKDWRTTIAGVLLAAIIIAALVTRPEWGAADFATFAAGIATAVLGALSRSAVAPADAPKPPTVPPVPPLALLVIACLAVVGCARPIDVAIASANVGRDVGLAAHDAIEGACVPAYKAATSREQIAAVDAKCLPAEKAYRLYAAAHTAAVLIIQRAQLGLATEADALAAAKAVGQAGGALASAVQAVSR